MIFSERRKTILSTQSPSTRFIPLVFMLAIFALMLSACGPVQANNYAGLSTDGKKVYVANQSFVFSVDAGNGTVDWKYPAKADPNINFYAAPAVVAGWVYAGGYNNDLYGFKLEGLDTANPTPTWTFKNYEGKGRFIGSPVVANDLVLAPSTDNYLYAIGAQDGQMKWRYKTRGALWGSPISDGKYVYQPGLEHYVYAVDLSSGQKKWEVNLGGPIVSGLTSVDGGLLAVGTLNQEIMAINSENGGIAWRKKIDGSLWSAPLLHEGKLYFGTDKSKIYIFSASDGTQIYSGDSSSAIIAAPVYLDNAVAFVTENGEVFSLSLDGQSRPWTRSLTKGKLYTTPIVVNNEVVFTIYQGDHILAGYDFKGTQDEKWNSAAPK
jgi:outer membrane protein assembly factor BamB